MLTDFHRTFLRFAIVLAIVFATQASNAQKANTSEKEASLLAVLRSEAPAAEKALVCKKLAIYGSDAAVPELAKLLPNPQLSSWARISLEAIPGEVSNDAFRKAADSLEGRLLVGVINSISFRRDSKAIDLLIGKLKDKDVEVASAAAVALGNIGGPAATQSLQGALAGAPEGLRSAIAEGCVLCAERLHTDGDSVAAAKLYDDVRKADVPLQRVIEATRGAILARKQAGIPLLMEIFRSPDKAMFQLALGTVREIPGAEVDKALASELNNATPERAALIVQAIADRPETNALPIVLKAAETGDKTVRMAAMNALQQIGDDSCLSTLLKIASDTDEDLASAAQQTVAVLPGERVNEEIESRLANASGEQRLVLLKSIGERRINAVDDVTKSLKNPKRAVRNAAFVALGETVSLKQMSVLVSQAVRPTHTEDADVARKALKTACVRMPDREACAAELATALDGAPGSAKSMLLEIVADVGGEKALKTIATAAKGPDPKLQDTGSRLLGLWNGVAAAPVLLDLAKTGPVEKYRVRALRGYLGLARKFAMPDQERAKMCQNAFDATDRLSEHKLALDVLKIHPSADGLKLAIDAMKNPELKDDATSVAMTIASKVGGEGVDVNKLLTGAGLDKVNLEIVKAEYGAGEQLKDVTNVLKKRSSGLPLITLRAAAYNTSFGGDPAPGVAKQLNVKYRINGKAGEASFKENALILLPMPK